MTTAQRSGRSLVEAPLPAVQLWHAGVAALAPLRERLAALLDASERDRAARLVRARDRTRYCIAHGVVRLALARYVDADPAALHFGAGAFGKPQLVSPAVGVAYNLSHSGDAILVAVTRGREIGVDVEQIVSDVDYESVAEAAFSPAERRELLAVAPQARRTSFFACWARKEAYIKATGLGISRGLDHLDVSLGSEAALIADRHDGSAPARWTMRSLALRDGYAAAVAFDGGDAPVVVRHVTAEWVVEALTLPRR